MELFLLSVFHSAGDDISFKKVVNRGLMKVKLLK